MSGCPLIFTAPEVRTAPPPRTNQAMSGPIWRRKNSKAVAPKNVMLLSSRSVATFGDVRGVGT
jgi:hypothetical protein